jgi:anti-sigma factor RsiW
MREIDRSVSDDDLQAYVDDCLDPSRVAVVEAYIASYPEVAARVAAYRQQRQQLRQAFAQAVPPRPDSDAALIRLAAARWQGRRQRRMLAAVAMIAVIIGIGSGWVLRDIVNTVLPLGETLNGLTALADEASTAHLVFAADHKRPIEIDAAHSADLTTWLSNRLARPVVPIDLAAAGYRFMGGRLVATDHGPAALFMYDDDKGTRLSLLIRPMAKVDMEAPPRAIKANGVDGYAWAQRGMGFSLVGATSSANLEQLTTQIRSKSGAGI